MNHNKEECCCVDCCYYRESNLTTDQAICAGELFHVEARYLVSFGWTSVGSIVLGAPVFWKDPIDDDERSQDIAIITQKMRVNSINKRRSK